MTKRKQKRSPCTADEAVSLEHKGLEAHAVARAVFVSRALAVWPSQQPSLKAEPDTRLRQDTALRELAAKPDSKSLADGAPNLDSGEHLKGGVFPTAGLALSGGGIRSAAFCTGALQALQVNKVFGLFDYMSTVSGGGYIGATVTLNQSKHGFVLLDGLEVKDSEALKTIRSNANYLKFGEFWQFLSNVLIFVRGIAANVVIVGAVLFLLASLTLFLNDSYGDMLSNGIRESQAQQATSKPQPLLTTIALALIFAFGVMLWAMATGWFKSFGAGLRSYGIIVPTVMAVAVALVFAFELQPLIVTKMLGEPVVAELAASCDEANLEVRCVDAFAAPLPAGSICPKERLLYNCKKPQTKVLELESSVGGAFARVYDWLKLMFAPFMVLVGLFANNIGNVLKNDDLQKTWRGAIQKNTLKLIVWAAAISFFLLLWSVYLNLVYWGVNTEGWTLPKREIPGALNWAFETAKVQSNGVFGPTGLYLAAGLLLAFCQWFFKPNSNSPQQLYNDRLGDAFCFRQTPTGVQPAAHTRMGRLKHSRPLPIVNTAINLQGSENVKRKGRKADVFSFTPYVSGSDATGFRPTTQYEALCKSRGEPLGFAKLIGTSGAAFSANMGNQTIRTLGPLLAFLNVRLGTWLPHPNENLRPRPYALSAYYFAQEAFSRLSETSPLIYLTDGGHFENLGIYELLRRRCALIVAIDAEADRKMSFQSFVMLQRHARIDLGCRIQLDWSEISKSSLDAMTGKSAAREGPHCAIGHIEYDNGGIGVLVYIKSSMSGDENDYIRDYNARYADFPHETTGDQNFSEEQFEVYRALGFHATNRMLTGEDRVQSDKGLESLCDMNAQSEWVKRAAVLLGSVTKNQPKPPAERNIQYIKILKGR